MESIFQPNDTFDYSNLSLAHPTGIQGGAYFTKIQMSNKPLYIETPKSLTRQGFVKHGKKYYCDLMFDNNDEQFIHWIENLETTCQQLIYKKADTWFESKLELNDIEAAFASPMRVYKSGKYYLLRVNVKVNYATNTPVVKIYSENEIPITIDDVAPEHSIISILEVQGIKFTSRNFQIELELKQAMVLNTDQIFERCIIKSNNKIKGETNPYAFIDPSLGKIVKIKEEESTDQYQENSTFEEVEALPLDDTDTTDPTGTTDPTNNISITINTAQDTSDETENRIMDNSSNNENHLVDYSDNLTEVNILDMSPDLETITLKKPNQVYYEIYRTAKKKAKEAKNKAIIAFLEAKNIKKTYMLEDLDDSDESDLDLDMDLDTDQFSDN
jgi:hypothetical protein